MHIYASSLVFVKMAPYLSSLSPVTATTSLSLSFSIMSFPRRTNAIRLVRCSNAAVSRHGQVAYEYDPELRTVLELATDAELYELRRMLFGPSYFSPLLKSILNRDDVEDGMIEENVEEREAFIAALESRFLFLAADARSTLRGWRPSYRNVLLSVRKKLNIPCSNKLCTQDLEAEIFLYLLRDYASEESGTFPGLWESNNISNIQNSLELGLSQWKVQVLAAGKVGAAGLQSIILKGGGVITLAKIYQLLTKKLSGMVFLEAANYLIKKEALKKGVQVAAINVESRAALLAAKQGFAGAASRYVGLRSMMSLLGPLLWGTFLADVVIQMLGTDYARILRAIYAFAQIRVTRTYRLSCKDD
ncbi:uncharacterized protein LOC111291399 isoform X1 [Durio zibethinus]|uniref:Uncharacterized protein LOC111291399 isoform X1 n=1 Tax=Durio zibethinus TaxID=66656 RepID=A0A6P5YEL6_DURZI|nr:uncharacterized protein LOC111291399 isoform X1 [Durio zibethinus]